VTFLVPPTPVVVDASVAVDLAIGDRAGTPERVREWIADGRLLLAPAIAWTEIGHAILRGLGRDAIAASRRLGEVEALGLETADRGPAGIRMAMSLAERHRLSVYDASYLWLAIDIDGELATFDADLARAAVAEGIPLAIEPSAN
jgi:predicted nucleic acid-binding protein